MASTCTFILSPFERIATAEFEVDSDRATERVEQDNDANEVDRALVELKLEFESNATPDERAGATIIRLNEIPLSITHAVAI